MWNKELRFIIANVYSKVPLSKSYGKCLVLQINNIAWV